MRAIQGLLSHRRDPDAADDHAGWAYEGFYFEARDRDGTPAFLVSNYWRGRSAGGGEWAAREALYPYPHG